MSTTNENQTPVKTTAAKAIAGAVYAGAVTALGTLGVALGSDSVVTGQEWVGIGLATVVAVGGAAGLIYQVPNTPKFD